MNHSKLQKEHQIASFVRNFHIYPPRLWKKNTRPVSHDLRAGNHHHHATIDRNRVRSQMHWLTNFQILPIQTTVHACMACPHGHSLGRTHPMHVAWWWWFPAPVTVLKREDKYKQRYRCFASQNRAVVENRLSSYPALEISSSFLPAHNHNLG